MTTKEKYVAKTIEKALAGMTPAEKEKTLIFIEGMAFRASIERAGSGRTEEAS